MTIRHRFRTSNGSADGLSRAPLPNSSDNPAADLDTGPEPRVQVLTREEDDKGRNFPIAFLTASAALASFPAPNDLSNPASELTCDVDIAEPYEVQALSFAVLDEAFFDDIRTSYLIHSDFSRIVRALERPDAEPTKVLSGITVALKKDFDAGRFLLLDGLLDRRSGSTVSLVVVDAVTRASLLSSCHDEVTSGHFSFDKTLARIGPLAWWPTIHADVEQYCRSCDSCQRAKYATGKP